MRWLAVWLYLLLAASAQAAADPARPTPGPPDDPLQEIAGAPQAFFRGAPLPDWAVLAAPPPVPPAVRRQPVVVRLSETQLHVGPPSTRLTNRSVQVNDASALAEIGQLALEFNPQFERLLLHRVLILRGGQTIDHTGTVPVRFLQREARLEQNLYSGVITVSIVLPGVRTGDTLQLVHSVVGENPALRARYSQRVAWEQTHAILLRRVTLLAPVERQVRWRWIGGVGGDGPAPTETVAHGWRSLRFETQALAAAAGEPLAPPRVQPLRRLQFSEYADWNEVARWAASLYPAAVVLPDEMAPVMARLRALPDPEERASQALQWVQTEIRHWAEIQGECALRPMPPAWVVQRGYGDCKGKAQLLTAMLRALGIDARPALASLTTRDGPASMLPSPEAFDHVIVHARLAGREYHLDPTRQGQVGLLPRMGQRLEGAAVLPIDDGTQALSIVRSPNRVEIFRNELREHLSLSHFGAEGRLEVEVRWFGVDAEALRVSMQRMGAAELRRFVMATYRGQYAGIRLLGEPEVNDDRRFNQLTINASFAVPQLARSVGGGWAVPFAPGLGDAIVLPTAGPRRFPLVVASFPVTFHYQVAMTWPDSATIADLPARQLLDTPHFRFRSEREVRANTEYRTIEFEAKVGEVPRVEIARLVDDLARMAQQIGGVMLAAGRDEPRPASLP